MFSAVDLVSAFLGFAGTGVNPAGSVAVAVFAATNQTVFAGIKPAAQGPA